MNQIRIALMTVTTVAAAAIAYAGFAPPSSKPVKTQVLASAAAVVKPETRVFAQVVSNSKPTLNPLYKPKTPMVQAVQPATPRIQFVAQHQIVARVVLQRVRTDEGNHESREDEGGERD